MGQFLHSCVSMSWGDKLLCSVVLTCDFLHLTVLIFIQQPGGPTAILFISHDTCGDSIAKLFRAYFLKWGIAQLLRGVLQNVVSHRCACMKLGTRYPATLGEWHPP